MSRTASLCLGAEVSTRAIADHALLSDRHSAALVSRDGSVDWLCFPRFDSPSVFARLLDDTAGHWSVRPVGQVTTTRRYVDTTLVLETTHTAPDGGVLVVTDLLVMGPRDHGHTLGVGVAHLLVRALACTAGSVEVEVEVAPRPEYALVHPLLTPVDGGIAARGGSEQLVLTSPLALRVDGPLAHGRWRLQAGDAVHLALHRAALGADTPARVWSQEELAAGVSSTVQAWRSWSALHQSYEGPWADRVHLSGRVLQALSFQPTGAIVAAPTTSLPEVAGGGRNWDYRYSWVRDASFTLAALWVAACPDEAVELFAFLTTAAASSVTARHLPLQIMFGVGGERDLTERVLPHLSGWRGSAPVRVGNGAWEQAQVDVYGELLDAALRLRDQLGALDAETRAFLVAVADTAAERWREPDNGIWELRGEPRHFLYSKLMCWVALDRAVTLAELLRAQDRVAGWTATREQIRAAVLEQGWSDEAGAFTQSFGSTALDASVLVLPIVGFLPADDQRVLSTIAALERDLTDERGLVYRYTAGDGDGLAGVEGTFLLCTFWLAQAHALGGRVARAREVFELAAGYANDLGLLAEEVDAGTGELLGNFPQALSHIGLVNAAWAISQAEDAARG